MTPRTTKRFGWIPDLPDHRDFCYSAKPRAEPLPDKVDLSEKCPPVYDQGTLGSCTANAIAGAFQFEQMRQKIEVFVPSRLFIYFNEREIEGTIDSDSGAMIRDGIKSVVKAGVCPEPEWPYREDKFRWAPDHECYEHAKKHQVLEYRRVARTLDMAHCLAEGFPFVFGFTVFESIDDPAVGETGRISLPAPDDRVKGGHAVLAVGYDDAIRCFKFRNSWGTTWGDKGHGYLPYAYFDDSNLTDDFWVIRMVEA